MSFADQAQAFYDRAIDNYETATLRRYSGQGAGRTYVDAAARARVMEAAEDPLAGGASQHRRRVIVLAQDVADAGFPVPVVRGDKLIFGQREANIEEVDDRTRRMGGRLIAYVLTIVGK
jgi:hypothetical protein